jgi:L-asparagine transporter-like permease
MEQLLVILVEKPMATIAGAIAMVCLATWPLFRKRPMLTTYIGNDLGFVVHYALIGHWTAVAMNGLMAVQTIIAIWLPRWPRFRWVYYALMPVLAVASLFTWQGLPSLLAAVATALSTSRRHRSLCRRRA